MTKSSLCIANYDSYKEHNFLTSSAKFLLYAPRIWSQFISSGHPCIYNSWELIWPFFTLKLNKLQASINFIVYIYLILCKESIPVIGIDELNYDHGCRIMSGIILLSRKVDLRVLQDLNNVFIPGLLSSFWWMSDDCTDAHNTEKHLVQRHAQGYIGCV